MQGGGEAGKEEEEKTLNNKQLIKTAPWWLLY